MSQRTIPKSLRLHNLKNWESYWISQNKEYSNYFFIEYQIKMFINKIFQKYRNNFFLDKIVINKVNNYLLVKINYETNPQKPLSVKIENLNPKLDILSNVIKDYFDGKYIINIEFSEIGFKILSKKFKKSTLNQKQRELFSKSKSIKNKKLLDFITLLIKYKKIEILNAFLGVNLKKAIKHVKYLKSINSILNLLLKLQPKYLKGYKIQFKGRVNGNSRSRVVTYQQGKTPFNTLEKKNSF